MTVSGGALSQASLACQFSPSLLSRHWMSISASTFLTKSWAAMDACSFISVNPFSGSITARACSGSIAHAPARLSSLEKPAVRRSNPVGGASGICISIVSKSAISKSSSGKAPVTMATAVPTMRRIWLYRKNCPRNRIRRSFPSNVGSTTHMWMVDCVCFITWSGRSLHVAVSESLTHTSIQGAVGGLAIGLARTGSDAEASAPLQASAVRGKASGALLGARRAVFAGGSDASSASPSPPSCTAASPVDFSSGAFRFLSLPLPLPLPCAFPFPLPSLPSAAFFRRSDALRRVKLWKEWQPSKRCITLWSLVATSSAVAASVSAPLVTFRARSVGSMNSYSRQEQACFASKLFGIFVALKHRTSFGSSTLMASTRP
mmetsp:Transcript_66529/g.119720  ORF Transcript_66529/g.119720 Transcript_66529/m.119720 type:complete len:375 (-) Transcript_66529:419-1543(-)